MITKWFFFSTLSWPVFERHGIRYSIESGTAIGSLRHHGLIPWDDDLDIAVLEEDESKLLGPVSKDLSKYNITSFNSIRQGSLNL